jgi:hypothetical protein
MWELLKVRFCVKLYQKLRSYEVTAYIRFKCPGADCELITGATGVDRWDYSQPARTATEDIVGIHY